MKMFRKLARIAGLAAVALLPLAAPSVFAQPTSGKPIRFIVPYPPGGPTDLMARILQPAMQARMGRTVLVENKPGAVGNLGTDLVAKSTPDGETILLASPGPLSVTPSLFKTMPYDTQRDLAPVIQISKFPLVLVVNPKQPFKDVKDFMAYVKANPSKLSYGSSGIGTPQHLVGVMFNDQAGASLLHVPYRGAGPALADLMATRSR